MTDDLERRLREASLFPRIVTHDEARQSAKNFIDAHFNNRDGKGVLTGIPARAEHDDLVLSDYIRQRRVADEAQADEIARLRAENEALREAVAPVFKKLDRDARGQGSGHCHTVPGIWDDDSSNGEKAGKPCEWCAQWERARTALQEGAMGELNAWDALRDEERAAQAKRLEQLEREVAEAVAAERERCAQVAEEYAVPLRVSVENAADAHTFALNTVGIAIVEAIAAAIRTGEAEQ